MDYKTIEDIGFKAFIDRIQNYSGVSQKSTVNGMGDDAAVISNPGSEFYTILSSEIFLEGVHFDLTYHPFKHLGYKIVTAAVSDVYAMNGIPEQLLINIDRKSTRLNSSHVAISYAVFCLKKKTQ